MQNVSFTQVCVCVYSLELVLFDKCNSLMGFMKILIKL